MTLTGNTLDSQGNIVKDAYYYKSNANGDILSSFFYIPTGEFSFDFDENDNLTYYRFGRPGYTQSGNQAFGNGGYLAANNPFIVRFITADSSGSILPIAGAGVLLLLLAKKKKAVGKLEVKDVTPYLIIGGALIAVGALNKLLQALGLEKSADDKALDNLSTDPHNFWNPAFYTGFTSYSSTITTDQATDFASTIYHAFGPFGYDIDAITGVFHQMRTQSNVSFLAKIFNDVYGADLFSFLHNGSLPIYHLSDSELLNINSYVSQLPTN